MDEIGMSEAEGGWVGDCQIPGRIWGEWEMITERWANKALLLDPAEQLFELSQRPLHKIINKVSKLLNSLIEQTSRDDMLQVYREHLMKSSILYIACAFSGELCCSCIQMQQRAVICTKKGEREQEGTHQAEWTPNRHVFSIWNENSLLNGDPCYFRYLACSSMLWIHSFLSNLEKCFKMDVMWSQENNIINKYILSKIVSSVYACDCAGGLQIDAA